MITTEGFKLNNLARFTPADPTLVAFNPTKLSEGALQTLQLANNLQKYQVQKSQMEELEALKQARIKAGLAGLELGAATDAERLRAVVPEVDARLAALERQSTQDKSFTRTTPLEEEARIAKLKFGRDEANAATSFIPTEYELKAGEAKNRLGDLSILGQTLPNRRIAEGFAALAKANSAPSLAVASEIQANTAPAKARLDAAQTQVALGSVESDKKAKDAKLAAETANLNAEALKNTGMANAYNAKPDIEAAKLAAANEKRLGLEAEIKALETSKTHYVQQQDALSRTNVINLKGQVTPLNSIESDAFEYDKNGNWVEKKGFFSNPKLPPATKQLLRDYQEVRQKAKDYDERKQMVTEEWLSHRQAEREALNAKKRDGSIAAPKQTGQVEGSTAEPKQKRTKTLANGVTVTIE